LPLLASLEERSTYEELDYLFGVEDGDILEDGLADEATRNVFDLFWETITLPVVEAFPCF